MKDTDKIYVICSNLNYKGTDNVMITDRAYWFVLAELNRTGKCKKYLYERCSPQMFNRKQYELLKEEYSRAIQRKYNVGENWEQNRWFVEQVRPTIFNY